MIPGVESFHPREVWVDRLYPILGPLDDPSNNDTVVIHYTGAATVSQSNIPALLRSKQKYWVDTRGYSLGYSFAVDRSGGVWQIRGWEYQSAANKDHNATTVPVLMLVDGDDMAPPQAVRSVRAIVAEAQRRSPTPPNGLPVRGRGRISPTCSTGMRTTCCAALRCRVSWCPTWRSTGSSRRRPL
jgi:hypothetical protein